MTKPPGLAEPRDAEKSHLPAITFEPLPISNLFVLAVGIILCAQLK